MAAPGWEPIGKKRFACPPSKTLQIHKRLPARTNKSSGIKEINSGRSKTLAVELEASASG